MADYDALLARLEDHRFTHPPRGMVLEAAAAIRALLAEREKVVSYLYDRADNRKPVAAYSLREAANAIERGEHLKEQNDG